MPSAPDFLQSLGALIKIAFGSAEFSDPGFPGALGALIWALYETLLVWATFFVNLFKQLKPLIFAARYTLLISGMGILLGLVVGAIICAAALSRSRWLRGVAAVYVSFLRGVPLLVLLLLVYYLLPTIGIDVPKMVAAVGAVGISSSAYVSEYWRGSILSLPRGQTEAAHAIGMSPFTIWTRIILPQAARISVPSLVNEAILLVKASSLVLVIGIMEITRAAQGQASITYRPLEAYLAAAAVYLVINLVLAAFGRFLEHRMNV